MKVVVRRTLTLAVLAMLVSGVASAQSTSGPFGPVAPIPVTATNWATTLAFPKFNPSLGTLTSVSIQLSGALTTELTVQTNAVPATGTAQTRVRFTVQDPTSNGLTPFVPNVLSAAFAFNLPAASSISSGSLAGNGVANNSYNAPAVLAAFTGAGNITLNASTLTSTVITFTSGNATVTQVTSAELTGTVTYTYTPLPDLTIDKTHAGSGFRPGDVVTFTLTPSNVGGGPTVGTYTVTDTLPAGLTATGFGGAGWTCAALPTLSCDSNTAIAGGSAGVQPITLTATVNAGVTGVLVNTAAISGGGETVTTNNTDDDSITVSVPDLRLTKTHAGAGFRPGDVVTFTLTPNNTLGSNSTAGVYTVTDTLPAGLTATAFGGAGWACAALPTLSCTNSTVIAAGAAGVQPITLTATVNAGVTGALVNTAAISGGGELNTGNNTASDSITVAVPDLRLTKTHTGTSFAPGDTVTFTLTPNNTLGGNSTTGVYTVTDTLPADMTATSISGPGWTCAALPTLSCTNATVIGAGAMGVQPITLVATIGPGASGTLTNNASVSGGGEINTTNNDASDSLTLGSTPDLTISKTHAGSRFVRGDTVTFTLTPANIGGGPTSGLYSVTDTLPAGLTAVSIGGPGWTCAALPALSCTSTTVIPAGATGAPPITLVASIAVSSGTLVNTARVSGGGETNTTNNTATDSLALTVEPDLTISKAHTGDVFAPGDLVTFTLLVTNVGNGPTSGRVTVTDALPAGLTATAVGGAGWACAALPDLSCTRADVLGVSERFPALLVTVRIGSTAAGTLTNTAVVEGGGETNTTNNTATDALTVRGVIDLTITKTHTGAFVRGGTGQYTIVVSNVGSRASSGAVVVDDVLPDGLTATAIAGGSSWSCALTPLRCDTAAVLAPGSSFPPITLTVTIAGDAPATVINTATVSGGGDGNPANNTATDPAVLTGAAPALSLTKVHVGEFVQGGTGSYLLTVTNSGTAPTSGDVIVTDPLAPGLMGTAISGPGWGCTLATLTCVRSEGLAPGASYPPITVTVTVASNAPASIVNVAATSGGGAPSTSRSSASNAVAVAGVISALRVEKHADRDFANLGDLLGYTILATNLSGQPYAGARVQDTLPVGFEYVAGSGRIQSGFDAEEPLEPDVTGRLLTFPLGNIAALPTRISYLVRIGPETRLGPNVNSARMIAVGTTGVSSASRETNIAVEIDPAGFTMRQYIVGRVFEDANANGSYDDGERPVAGARIFLSTGISVTTDRMGLYNVPFVAAGSVVVALDPVTVPKGYRLSPGDRLDADSWSRLVRTPVLGGTMLRQNFGLIRCPSCALAAVSSAAAPEGRATSSRPPARLTIDPPEAALPGDGRSAVPLRVRVLDDQGNPATAGQVRIRTTAGQFVPVDGPLREPGLDPLFGAGTEAHRGATLEAVPEPLQAAIAHDVPGEVTFTLVAAASPGTARLVVESGDPEHLITTAAEITFTPEPRTPILVTNGEIAFGRAASDALVHGESNGVSRHLEAFMQTPVGGPSLLTLAYSSRLTLNEINGNAGLFQIDPLDRAYPLFGDSSTRYQVAQAQSQFYGRFDFRRSYVVFGDLRMGTETMSPAGGGYVRNLVGAAIHLESPGRQSLTLKAARPDTTYARDLFIGSAFGLVRLSHDGIVPGSETVAVEVRDARNPAVLLSRETLVRSVDYSLDHATGGLFFLRSLNAYDEALNLVQIVATYEHQSAGVTSKIYSARTDLHYRGLRVGLGITDQQHPTFGSYALGDVTVRQSLPRSGRLEVDLPISRGLALAAGYTPSAGVRALGDVDGSALRVELDQPFGLMNGRIRGSFARTDAAFFNPFGSTVVPGARSGRAGVELSPSSASQLSLSFTDERNETTLVDNTRRSGAVAWKQAPVNWLRLAAGYDLRDFDDHLQGRSITSQQLSGEVGWKPTGRLGASIRREQNLGDDSDPTYPSQTLLNAHYQATDTARLFFTQRLAEAPITPIGDLSRTGLFLRPTRNQTSLGVEDRWGRYTSIRSRYLVEQGASSTDTFAVIGLVNRIPVGNGVTIEVAGERGQLITGTDSSFHTGSGGFSWQPDVNFRTSSRYELRSLGGLGHILTTGAAGQIADGVTVMGRFQASSAAYRPGTAAIDVLSPRAVNPVLAQQVAANHSLAALAWRPWLSDRQIVLFSYNRRSMDLRGETMAPHTDAITQLSVDGLYQPLPALELYGRLALSERAFDYDVAAPVANRTWLAQGRAQTRLGRRFDVALEGRHMRQPSTAISQTTLAAEGGVWITRDVRGGIGYNFKSSDVLAANFLGDAARRGVYVVLSTKLSNLFNLFERTDCGCAPATAPPPPPAPVPPLRLTPIAGETQLCTGAQVVLRTSTAGGEPGAAVTYQWLVDGQPVPGATGPELALASAAPGSRRTIAVRASNGSQTATAEPVTVSVFAAPTLQFSITPPNQPSGGPAVALAASVTSASGPATISYSGEGVSGTSFDPSAVGGFDPGNRLREQTRTITVTASATDRCQQVATAAATVTVTRRPEPMRRDIVFASRSARVNNAAKRYLLDELTPRLRDDPAATVILVGHRDTLETGAAARTLDRRRALNAAAVLSAGTGICPMLDLSRVQIGLAGTDQTREPLPFGEASVRERAAGGGSPADQRAPWRRVEVWFVPGGAEPPSIASLQPAPATAVRALGCPR